MSKIRRGTPPPPLRLPLTTTKNTPRPFAETNLAFAKGSADLGLAFLLVDPAAVATAVIVVAVPVGLAMVVLVVARNFIRDSPQKWLDMKSHLSYVHQKYPKFKLVPLSQ